MIFLKGSKGGRLPVDADTVKDPEAHTFDRAVGHIPHFATCPDAEKFRRKRP
jgi:hypothetical protein